MSDDLRRLFEQQDSLRRMTDSLKSPYDRFGMESEVTRFLEDQGRHRKLLANFADTHHMARLHTDTLQQLAAEAERYGKMLEGPLEDARQLGLLGPDSSVQRALAQAIEANQAYERLFHIPGLGELSRLAADAAATSRLAASVFGDLEAPATLQARMTSMRSPWVNIGEWGRSALAFADVQAIGRIVNQDNPFAASPSALLRPGLGDWRDSMTFDAALLIDPAARTDHYIEQGFDPSLTDFTVSAFQESIEIAGLQEPEDAPSSTEPEELDEAGLARNQAAFDKLQRFETALRRFIVTVMSAAYGDEWMKHQLPGDMLDRWQAKKEAAMKAGETGRPLISYADFTDYRAIIERKDNWNNVFKLIFGRADDVRESFQRLFPVRIATMHARIITLDDELLLLVETRRILRVIKGTLS